MSLFDTGASFVTDPTDVRLPSNDLIEFKGERSCSRTEQPWSIVGPYCDGASPLYGHYRAYHFERASSSAQQATGIIFLFFLLFTPF